MALIDKAARDVADKYNKGTFKVMQLMKRFLDDFFHYLKSQLRNYTKSLTR